MADFVVAIDGPAGSGKSSVSKAVAKSLGYGYLDTGAGYRSFALHKLANPNLALEELVATFEYEITLDPASQVMKLAGADVTEDIRGERAANAVSEIAREPMVRQLQLKDARTRISNCDLPGIVVEGRDITTVVAPDANLRILLTASEAVRLKRRGLEQTESPANLIARDASDAKVVDFFTPAEGVVLIDTSDMDFDASVMAVLEKVKAVQNG